MSMHSLVKRSTGVYRCLRVRQPQVKIQCRFNSSNSGSSKQSSSSSLAPTNLFANGVLGKTIIFAGGAIFGAWLYQNDIKEKAIKSTISLNEMELPEYASDKEIDQAVDKIREIFKADLKNGESYDEGLYISHEKSVLDEHADTYFNTHHALDNERSHYVLFPRLTAQVSEILKLCHKYKIPVVATGGRSSLEGHFIPTRGGISLDLSNMDAIVHFKPTDLDITVEAGLGWEALNDYLEEYRLMFPVDPGPGATVGGCVTNNSSGTNATRYGAAFANVVSLTVVLADGTVVRTKKRPRKTSAGYNLNGLFTGSEGTLGIITEVTVKLHVKPKVERVAVVPFKTIKDAANSVNEFLISGINLNAIELLDDKMMKCVNDSGETTRKWTQAPTLFLRIGGSNDEVVKSTINQTKEISAQHGSLDFQFASNEDETVELWSARKVALWSTINQGKLKNDDIQLWTTDTAVPISQLPRYLVEVKKTIDDAGLENTLVAHIGDGNAHSFILYHPEEHAKAERIVHNIVKKAIELEGTCTGEHGIGYGKIDLLEEELGLIPIDVMRKLKLALDPQRILNPDKVFRMDPNKKLE